MPETLPALIDTPSGLRYHEQSAGEGDSPQRGQTVQVHYTGWLVEGDTIGRKFDSSRDRGQPFSFRLGVGQVIPGWDLGVAEMKTGSRRLLVLPPELGYGARGAGAVIPPNSTLAFDVELLSFA
ncbi:peptidylprolyl isomerase [Endobacter medicaginis]|uniref:Peptidyl-prolyl cis-trans isomerase n=1 Tax=Endobacter medicaginis TaxID=1181271 RepID=A0A839V198_9PROT|nr:FKBP-type peptidyl-prolyl cis-trans isomerase [Endobacter medicaginis]MBB3174615.1 peptidylprolyl isomerase [Endobacter medicaginis]MCX5474693.1 FKBP-type peptidyl-prolyl cis-trans isomerase [Endobacter medicaginis]NVN30476.1 FKBP-type peptidyl-prolyl cis-trans isomerase [Endobacter medicaginis]